MNPRRFVAVAFVHIQDKKLLLTRSKGKKAFYLPGGKPEHDETDHETLARELQEELSLFLDINSVSHVGTFEAQAYGEPEGVVVELRCYTGKHDGAPTPHAEIDEMQFFSFEEYMSMPETAAAVRKLFSVLKERDLVE